MPEARDGSKFSLETEFGGNAGVYYPVPVHRLPALREYFVGPDLEETERASREVLSLPIPPGLSHRNMDRITDGSNTLARAGS